MSLHVFATQADGWRHHGFFVAWFEDLFVMQGYEWRALSPKLFIGIDRLRTWLYDYIWLYMIYGFKSPESRTDRTTHHWYSDCYSCEALWDSADEVFISSQDIRFPAFGKSNIRDVCAEFQPQSCFNSALSLRCLHVKAEKKPEALRVYWRRKPTSWEPQVDLATLWHCLPGDLHNVSQLQPYGTFSRRCKALPHSFLNVSC